MNTSEDVFKKQLIKHLKGGEAFMSLEDLLKEIPYDKVGIRSEGLPYSFYEIFYHIRYAQKDILDFCKANFYKAPNWPDDYWPEESSPKNETDWEKLKDSYIKEREKFVTFISSEEIKLMNSIPNGKSQSLLREILLVIEHTAYHTGQLLIILRLLKLHK